VTPPPDAAIAAAPDATPDAAPVTTYRVGDVVSVRSHNDIYDTEQAIGGARCLAVEPHEDWHSTAVLDFAVATVVAVSTTCPGNPETLAIDVGNSVVPIRAAAVRPIAAACLPAMSVMYDALIPAWTACVAKSPWKGSSDIADVTVRFTAAGVVDDVSYYGTTGWGEKAALCIIKATKRAKLDGRACAGETIRLTSWL